MKAGPERSDLLSCLFSDEVSGVVPVVLVFVHCRLCSQVNCLCVTMHDFCFGMYVTARCIWNLVPPSVMCSFCTVSCYIKTS